MELYKRGCCFDSPRSPRRPGLYPHDVVSWFVLVFFVPPCGGEEVGMERSGPPRPTALDESLVGVLYFLDEEPLLAPDEALLAQIESFVQAGLLQDHSVPV